MDRGGGGGGWGGGGVKHSLKLTRTYLLSQNCILHTSLLPPPPSMFWFPEVLFRWFRGTFIPFVLQLPLLCACSKHISYPFLNLVLLCLSSGIRVVKFVGDPVQIWFHASTPLHPNGYIHP